MEFENSLAFAEAMDANDELAHFRSRFIIPEKDGEEQIYFLGNSLGLQPRSTQKYIQHILDDWGRYGVEGFFTGKTPWYHYHDQLAYTLSLIVGALPHEVVVMNQLSVNLHLMMVSFYQPEGRRNKIICEAKAFPSDQYMFETYLRHLGLNPDEIIIEIAAREAEYTIRTEDILHAIEVHKNELALVMFGGVNYYTGQVLDLKTITAAAHQSGAKAGFDLAHAAGNIPLLLHDWGVDFACWCGYKYLNSGPGAVGGVYIHERFHHDISLQRLGGWWGYDKEARFKMEKGFKPVLSAEGWQLSTPSMILFACHKAALEIFEEAGLEKLFMKGQQLSNYLLYLLNEINSRSKNKSIDILTPQTEAGKGCQVSMLMLKDGRKIFDELGKQGVFADWREPNVIRVAPVPLYNRFKEVWKFAEVMRNCLKFKV
ncbi:MAG: kynureninase [Chitinophagaceae bacterium]|nr:kynureninase [Chitinophagaceae bacterium]